jgi:HD-like signal output (HDOD) protein
MSELNIMFVDDDQRILDGLRRQLHTHRGRWTMRFCISAEAALASLQSEPADVVITDMRMPVMTGAQLLQQVWERHPHTARIILWGQTDQSSLIKNIRFVQQYLQKPCDPNHLCRTLQRTAQLSNTLNVPTLRNAANHLLSLPAAAGASSRLVEELSKPQPDAKRVEELISADPAMSAKLLQLAKSSFFCITRSVASVHDAVVLLGLSTIQAVVLAGKVFDAFQIRAEHQPLVDELWRCSMETADRAGRLAAADGLDHTLQQRARLAGMLSLVGRAVFLCSFGDDYLSLLQTAKQSSDSLLELEFRHFGAGQDQLAAYMLGIWSFSQDIVTAIAWQSRPTESLEKSPLLSVLHQARSMSGKSPWDLDSPVQLDADFIARHESERLQQEQGAQHASLTIA